ncbi:hypothetical protein DPEC_G00279750 [Dallia pectoralis]|uniref:Uncharacterized protein n=1 Tax=Dallia pectoralis TaxID=75939 RepID=A0ACC2FMC1_DALPE|nr:hypothetical protein DPEC_G00279750 [Dallia pectoralis]
MHGVLTSQSLAAYITSRNIALNRCILAEITAFQATPALLSLFPSSVRPYRGGFSSTRGVPSMLGRVWATNLITRGSVRGVNPTHGCRGALYRTVANRRCLLLNVPLHKAPDWLNEGTTGQHEEHDGGGTSVVAVNASLARLDRLGQTSGRYNQMQNHLGTSARAAEVQEIRDEALSDSS